MPYTPHLSFSELTGTVYIETGINKRVSVDPRFVKALVEFFNSDNGKAALKRNIAAKPQP